MTDGMGRRGDLRVGGFTLAFTLTVSATLVFSEQNVSICYTFSDHEPPGIRNILAEQMWFG